METLRNYNTYTEAEKQEAPTCKALLVVLEAAVLYIKLQSMTELPKLGFSPHVQTLTWW